MVFTKIMGNSLIHIRHNKIVRLAFLFAMLSLFSACYTLKSVQIEVMKPAKIVIPPAIQSITLLNASLPPKSELIGSKGALLVYSVDSFVTQELLNYTNEKLLESSRFVDVKIHNKAYPQEKSQRLRPIKWEDSESICYQNKTDGLLALEALEMIDTLIRYTIVDQYGYQSGKAFALICKSLWRLYQPEKQKIVVQKLFTDTVFFNEFDSRAAFRNTLKNVENREWLANTLANELGFKVNETLAPYWVSVKRDMIIGGGVEMEKAADYAAKDKWKEAARIWQILTKDDDVKIASVACYNMALVCEVQGRLDLAIAWLDKSDEIYTFQFAELYRSVLNYRIAEANVLDKQFGIDKME